jgi:hypothetical protein
MRCKRWHLRAKVISTSLVDGVTGRPGISTEFVEAGDGQPSPVLSCLGKGELASIRTPRPAFIPILGRFGIINLQNLLRNATEPVTIGKRQACIVGPESTD